MRIHELEKYVGTDRATIRFYEKEGLITPKRQENGYRDYSAANAEELKKICLLRQLGVSIGKIRSLQQGSEDFQEVLSDQIVTLTNQIVQSRRARAICEILQNDKARYESLDAGRYLQMLRELQIEEQLPTNKDFKESIPKEIHPWRRYFARMFDYGLLNTIVSFVIIVLLRMRPFPGKFMHVVIVVFAGALFVPLEALMLSRWGTTPGKFIFGIRVEYYEGGNLSFYQALIRAKSVYTEGVLLRVPFLRVYSMIRCYCRLTGRSFARFVRYDGIPGPEEMSWDNESELTYCQWNWKRGVALAGILALGSVMLTVTTADSIRPKHRGNKLTIAQFAENYNYYIDILDGDAQIYDKLQSDGKKYPVPSNQVMIEMASGEPTKPLEYAYKTENGFLRSVIIQKKSGIVFSVTPMNLVVEPLLSILLAQDNIGIPELSVLLQQFQACSEAPEGEFMFRDIIQVEWLIRTENCVERNGTYYPAESDNSLDFWCIITILE